MAKYTINHRCGHTSVRDLFGKHADRERKIAYFEQGDCPQCWAAAKRAKEAAEPITATAYCNGLDMIDGYPVIEVVLSGNTMPRKEDIKSCGYRWTERRGGLLETTFGKPQMAWVKMYAITDISVVAEIGKAIKSDLDGIAEKFVQDFGPLDAAALKNTFAKKAEADAKKSEAESQIAEIAKPERPACHPGNREGRWNGKYYGKPGCWNYYVSNHKYDLTDEEYTKCMAYREAVKKYNDTVNALKNN